MAGLAVLRFCGVCGRVDLGGDATGGDADGAGLRWSAGRGGSSLVDVVGGGVDVEGFCSFDEQPATVSVSSAPHSATRWGYLRMPLNLCNMSAPSGPATAKQRSRKRQLDLSQVWPK